METSVEETVIQWKNQYCNAFQLDTGKAKLGKRILAKLYQENQVKKGF
jgi:hypothetical protein